MVNQHIAHPTYPRLAGDKVQGNVALGGGAARKPNIAKCGKVWGEKTTWWIIPRIVSRSDPQ